MIKKKLHEIEKDDIESLVTEKRREARTIEYKLKFPADKREFLADVSSFANASGGDIVFGIKEKVDEAKTNTGMPEAAVGLKGSIDQALLRWTQVIKNGLDPTLLGIDCQVVEGFPLGPVVVLRVPRSRSAPHMVTRDDDDHFYTRDGNGKHRMDVHEIRSAFALSESLPEKLRRFRDGRLARIIADDTPMRLTLGRRLVLHVVPMAALVSDTNIVIPSLREIHKEVGPMCATSWNERFNFDGYLTYQLYRNAEQPEAETYTYLQVFHTGALEAVCGLLCPDDSKKHAIPGRSVENDILNALDRYVPLMRTLDFEPPIYAMVSLIGVKDHILLGPLEIERPIRHDDLLLPDVVIEDFDADRTVIMKPAFDSLWRAGGYPSSYSYDDQGKWNRQVRPW